MQCEIAQPVWHHGCNFKLARVGHLAGGWRRAVSERRVKKHQQRLNLEKFTETDVHYSDGSFD